MSDYYSHKAEYSRRQARHCVVGSWVLFVFVLLVVAMIVVFMVSGVPWYSTVLLYATASVMTFSAFSLRSSARTFRSSARQWESMGRFPGRLP